MCYSSLLLDGRPPFDPEHNGVRHYEPSRHEPVPVSAIGRLVSRRDDSPPDPQPFLLVAPISEPTKSDVLAAEDKKSRRHFAVYPSAPQPAATLSAGSSRHELEHEHRDDDVQELLHWENVELSEGDSECDRSTRSECTDSAPANLK